MSAPFQRRALLSVSLLVAIALVVLVGPALPVLAALVLGHSTGIYTVISTLNETD